jgi:hypothetical protein
VIHTIPIDRSGTFLALSENGRASNFRFFAQTMNERNLTLHDLRNPSVCQEVMQEVEGLIEVRDEIQHQLDAVLADMSLKGLSNEEV